MPISCAKNCFIVNSVFRIGAVLAPPRRSFVKPPSPAEGGRTFRLRERERERERSLFHAVSVHISTRSGYRAFEYKGTLPSLIAQSSLHGFEQLNEKRDRQSCL
jgi:hypothetical protein